MAGTPVEIARIRKVCADAYSKIDGLHSADPAKASTYAEAKDWITKVSTAVGMPDPWIDANTGDQAANYENFKSAFFSDDCASLHNETKKDLQNLGKKFQVYNGLLKAGDKLVENTLTKGLIEDETVDHQFLSILAPLRDVESYLQSSVALVDSVLQRSGVRYKSAEPELGERVAKTVKTLSKKISSSSLCAASSAGAAEIAKERGINERISMKRGQALLNQAIDDAQIEYVAKHIEDSINDKKAEFGPTCEYIRVRLREGYGKAAVAVDGKERGFGEGMDIQFNVEVVARDDTGAINAIGSIGSEISAHDFDLQSGYSPVVDAIDAAYKLARENAIEKFKDKTDGMMTKGGKALTSSITDLNMADIPVVREKFKADYDIDSHPMHMDVKELTQKVKRLSKKAMKRSPDVKKNVVYAMGKSGHKVFVDSDGRMIIQEFMESEGGFYVTAAKDGKMPESYYATLAGAGGFEVLFKGRNGMKQTLDEFVIEETDKTMELAGAEFFPKALSDGSGKLNVYEKDGKLYTDGKIIPTGLEPKRDFKHNVLVLPDAGWLMQHEMFLGHALEYSRAINENDASSGNTALANFYGNMLGKQLVSPLITAGFDPRTPGVAHHLFDGEGTPAREVITYDKGVLKEFITNRETAALLNRKPTSSARASEDSLENLMRMGNMFFRNGTSSREEMTAGLEDGYIVWRSKVPSMTAGRMHALFALGGATPVATFGDSKEGRVVHDEKTGKPKVYRDPVLMADSFPFWRDDFKALGNDGVEVGTPICGNGSQDSVMEGISVAHFIPSFSTRANLLEGEDAGSGPDLEGAITGYVRSLGKRWEV